MWKKSKQKKKKPLLKSSAKVATYILISIYLCIVMVTNFTALYKKHRTIISLDFENMRENTLPVGILFCATTLLIQYTRFSIIV